MLSEEEIQANLRAKDAEGEFHFQAPHRGLERLQEFVGRADFARAENIVFIEMPQSDLSWLSKCTNLRTLYALSLSTHQVDFAPLSALKHLEADGKFLKRIIGLEQLEPLESLSLNSPPAEQLARLGGNSKLLYVGGPPLVWPVFEETKFVDELKIVGLRKGPLDVANIGLLRGLKLLNLSDIHQGIVNADKLASLENLEHLFLWNVRSMDSKDWILSLPKLRKVSIWDKNDFTESDLDKLRAKGVYDF